MALFDSVTLESETVRLDVDGVPTPLMPGDPCSGFEVPTACPEGYGCEDEDPRTNPPGTCVVATPPVLENVSAWVVPESLLLVVGLQGEDPEANILGMTLQLLAGQEGLFGSGLPFTFDEPQAAEMDEWFYVNLAGACQGAGQDARDACLARGGAHWECLLEMNAASAACLQPLLESLTAVEVSLFDGLGLHSETLRADFQPPDDVEAGAECDAFGVATRCPEGTACFAADDVEALACRPVMAECPPAFGPAAEFAPDGEGPWLYEGDLAEAQPVGVGARCGGGGPTSILRFMAPTTGTFAARIVAAELPAGEDRADTVLYARSHCGIPHRAYDLACNNDVVDVGLFEPGRVLSAIQLDLEAGEVAYLFVGGNVASPFPAAEGAYTLAVTAL